MNFCQYEIAAALDEFATDWIQDEILTLNPDQMWKKADLLKTVTEIMFFVREFELNPENSKYHFDKLPAAASNLVSRWMDIIDDTVFVELQW